MSEMAKSMGIAEVKARFLSLAVDVATKRQPLLVTKNGKALVQVVPCETNIDPLERYKIGGGRIVGDIESPVNDPDDWEYD